MGAVDLRNVGGSFAAL